MAGVARSVDEPATLGMRDRATHRGAHRLTLRRRTRVGLLKFYSMTPLFPSPVQQYTRSVLVLSLLNFKSAERYR